MKRRISVVFFAGLYKGRLVAHNTEIEIPGYINVTVLFRKRKQVFTALCNFRVSDINSVYCRSLEQDDEFGRKELVYLYFDDESFVEVLESRSKVVAKMQCALLSLSK